MWSEASGSPVLIDPESQAAVRSENDRWGSPERPDRSARGVYAGAYVFGRTGSRARFEVSAR
jgi:hypothetical protein